MTHSASSPAEGRHVVEPAMWIGAGVLLLTAMVTIIQLYQNAALYPVAKRAWGNDFRFFYNGARLFIEGLSPYLDPYYTSPPPAAMFFGLLALLPFGTAYTIVFGASVLFCLFSIWLIARHLLEDQPAIDRKQIFLLTSAALVFGFPFQFLIERGNIDALILLLVITGVVFIRRNQGLSGALLGLAAALKIYPVVLFFPLLVRRQWRVVITGAGTFLLMGVLTITHWGDWIRQFAIRDRGFRVDENTSLANTVAHVIHAVQPDFAFPVQWATTSGTLLFVFLLAALLWTDFRRRDLCIKGDAAHLLLYFPLMVSYPNLVHNYELVFVLTMVPALCWLWTRSRCSRVPMALLVCGASLSQLQVVSLHQLLGDIAPHAFPSIGLLLMTAGAIWLKYEQSTTQLPATTTAGVGSSCPISTPEPV